MNFSLKEIIDIAVGLETAGHEFYSRCALKFDNKKVADIFLKLADDELGHKKTFQSMDTASSGDGMFNEEYLTYMKSIAGGRVFGGRAVMDEILGEIDTPAAAIKRAFLDEKGSIFGYSEAKNLYGKGAREFDLLDRIISEERKHVLALVDLLDGLK